MTTTDSDWCSLAVLLAGLARPECGDFTGTACCAEHSNLHKLCECLDLGLMLPTVRESNPMLEWNPLYSLAGRPAKAHVPSTVDDEPHLKFWDGRLIRLPPLSAQPGALSCNVNSWQRRDFPI